MELLLTLLVVVLFLWVSKHATRIASLEKTIQSLSTLPFVPTHRAVPAQDYRAPAAQNWVAPRPAFEQGPPPPPPPEPPPPPAPEPRPERVEPDLPANAEPPPQLPTIDWERWIGVRGAAALGAAILVVALLYFLRYSADAGWLTPAIRVYLGAAFAAGCVVAAQWKLRSSHATLSSWLTGAGIAGLFATAWAANQVVGLIGPIAAFSCAVAITVLGIALALRDDSVPIGLLGLLGGFAAPLSLSLGTSNAYGVLAYIALLDIGMVVLAIKKRWWALLVLSMLATAGYEAAWVSASGGSGSAMHVAILTIFAALFGALPSLAPALSKDERGEPHGLAQVARYGALVLPYAFALKMALDPAMAATPASLGALMVLLTILAAVLVRVEKRSAMLFVPVVGNALVIGAWMLSGHVTDQSTALGALLVVLAVPPALCARDPEAQAASYAFGLHLVLGSLLTLVAAFVAPASFLVWSSVLLLFAATAVTVSWFSDRAAIARLAVVAGTTMLGFIAVASGVESSTLAGPIACLAIAMVGLGTCVALARFWSAVKQSDWAAAVLDGSRTASIVLLMLLIAFAGRAELVLAVGAIAVASALALASMRTSYATFPTVGALAALGLATSGWMHEPVELALLAPIAFCLFAVHAAFPMLDRRGLGASAWAPRGQALSLLLFTAALLPSHGGLRAVEYGVLCAAAAVVALSLMLLQERSEQREEAGTWLGVTAMSAAAAAIGLSLHAEARLCAWAVLGVGLIALHRRLGHSSLLAGAILQLGGVTLALLNPDVLVMHQRGDTAIFNWITPTFLVPAICCAIACVVTTSQWVQRMLGAFALGLLFVWCNVCVIDLHAHGVWLSLSEGASQSRDLSISLVWGVFGVALLIGGVARDLGALRWASLGLVLVTAAKVFLYDLAHLEDLYRVGALLGLATSLLVISLMYQRFVFKKGRVGQQAVAP